MTASLRDALVDALMDQLPGVHETVPRSDKVAGSAHVCIEGIEKATGVDVANKIVRFVERHAKPGRTRTRGKG